MIEIGWHKVFLNNNILCLVLYNNISSCQRVDDNKSWHLTCCGKHLAETKTALTAQKRSQYIWGHTQHCSSFDHSYTQVWSHCTYSYKKILHWSPVNQCIVKRFNQQALFMWYIFLRQVFYSQWHVDSFYFGREGGHIKQSNYIQVFQIRLKPTF